MHYSGILVLAMSLLSRRYTRLDTVLFLSWSWKVQGESFRNTVGREPIRDAAS